MRAIQRFLPNPRHTEINRIFVQASPEVAWETARHFDAADIPWVRLLFDIRSFPDLLAGKRSAADRSVGVDQITRQETGFMILEEKAGHEVVIGSIGQFWHLHIPFLKINQADFAAFNEPGWGKLAWCISVEPFRDGSTISLELRTTATDDDSWSTFQRYYALIGLGSKPIRSAGMAHLKAQLGKMKQADEDEIALPGDELLPGARYALNHAADIEAPPALVWRYLMQLGCDRAGWYSIDALDHGGVPSTDHPVRGWETRSPGDHLDATPQGDGFFHVYSVDPERSFVIGGRAERLGGQYDMTWAFVLEPVGHDACRLYTRVRAAGDQMPKWKEWLLAGVFYPPVHALMENAQLKNIKRLAERDAQAR